MKARTPHGPSATPSLPTTNCAVTLLRCESFPWRRRDASRSRTFVLCLPQDLEQGLAEQPPRPPPLVSIEGLDCSSHGPSNFASGTSKPVKDKHADNFKQFSPAARSAQDTNHNSLQRPHPPSSSASLIFVFPTSGRSERCRPFHSPMKAAATHKLVWTVSITL